jgi:hypothetical protein
MTRVNRFRRLYGESPFQLVILLASFALSGYAAVRFLDGDWFWILVWFVGSAILHDLVLVPLYAVCDRAVQAALGPDHTRSALPRTAVNHVRVPAYVSLLLLLVYWPLVLRNAPHPYELTTGLSVDVFLGRWLLITAALFIASAVWLVLRLWRARSPRRSPVSPG